MRRVWRLVLAVVLVCGGSAVSTAKTILYVPQDDRPVDLAYTTETARAAGYTVLTPPAAYLSGASFTGNAEALASWVEAHAGQADAMVLSMDSLLYGGLADSRKHGEAMPVLQRRLQRVERWHRQYAQVPIYAFSTVMRSPWAGGRGVEPAYYLTYGRSIYSLAALQYKWHTGTLSAADKQAMFQLMGQIPLEYLQDWYSRRQKNMVLNERLIEDARNHVFTYFCLGHDDNSQHTQSSLEVAYLEKIAAAAGVTDFASFPGADQLGLLLIARAHNDFQQRHPTVQVLYPLGTGGETVPRYDGQAVEDTVAAHIQAIGGREVTTGRPDLLLAVYTPLLRGDGEAATVDNVPIMSASARAFLQQIRRATRQHIPVSIVDLTFSNGSDNTLLYGLYTQHMLYTPTAYNGWNTAGNAIGYGIGQGILAASMTAADRKNMLAVQYLDNWAYQANVRDYVQRMQLKMQRHVWEPCYAEKMTELQSLAKEQVQRYARLYLGLDPHTVEVTLPWRRLFEVAVQIRPQGDVPEEAQVRRQLREDRIKAREERVRAAAAALAQADGNEPADGKTPAQLAARQAYEDAVADWQRETVAAADACTIQEEEERAQTLRTWQPRR